MNIIIFGIGAIGSNLLAQLHRKYPDFQFCGVDYDTVEERNLNTQAYVLTQIGMPKAHAMAINLFLKSKHRNYVPISKKIENAGDIDTLVIPDSLVIDCFDNAESRGFIHGENCLHIGFSPQYAAEIIWHENYSVPGDIPADQNDICEMSEAIPFINFVVSLACMNISDFIESGVKRDLIITNKNIIRYL